MRIKKYLKARFGATLSSDGTIYGPNDKIGAIIGRKNEEGKRHLDYLKELLKLNNLRAIPFKK